MNISSFLSVHRLRTLTVGAFLTGLSAAHAGTTLYWDANGSTSGVGGSGEWNTTGLFWNPSSGGTGTLQSWNNDGQDTAILGGPGGNVTVEGVVTAGRLDIKPESAAGYLVTGGTLNLTMVTPTGAGSSVAISSSGAVTVSSDLLISNPQSANRFRFTTGSDGQLTLGNIAFESSSTNAVVALQGAASSSTITVSGTVGSNPGTGTSSIQIGGDSAVSGATYIFKGDNSALEANTSGVIVQGRAILEHGKALGLGRINLGNGSTGASDVLELLTGAAITVANNIATGGSATTATRIIGGDTADESEFSGTLTLSVSGTYRVTAAAGGVVTFSNTITDEGGANMITKVGDGIVRFTKQEGNTYGGGTVISAGTLLVENRSNSATGSGFVTVEAGAALGGDGIIAGDVTIAGTLSPGTNQQPTGALSLNGNVTLGASASVLLAIAGTESSAFDAIRNDGDTLTMGGELVIEINGSFQAGDQWTLFDGFANRLEHFDTVRLTGDYNGLLVREDGLWGQSLEGLQWTFDESTGMLSVAAIPEPRGMASLALTAVIAALLKKRRALLPR